MYSKINTHNLVISRINSLQEIYESIRAMITGMPRRLKAPISAKCRQNYHYYMLKTYSSVSVLNKNLIAVNHFSFQRFCRKLPDSNKVHNNYACCVIDAVKSVSARPLLRWEV